MILGNVNTFNSYDFTSDMLTHCLEILRALPHNAPCGKVELDGCIFYTVMDTQLSNDNDKLFETHQKYTDIQYILSGTEQMIYSDINSLTPSVPYSPEKDIAFHSGSGISLILNVGDFAVFTPTDAHACGIGNGFARKVVMKVPVYS